MVKNLHIWVDLKMCQTIGANTKIPGYNDILIFTNGSRFTAGRYNHIYGDLIVIKNYYRIRMRRSKINHELHFEIQRPFQLKRGYQAVLEILAL